MRMLTSRAITAAAAAAIALSTMTIQPAAAGSRHGMLAAFAAIFGTVAAIIAAEQQRDSYSYSHGPVYGGPVYGGPPHGTYRHWQQRRHPYGHHR
jgi:hypothetical protein